MAEWRPVAPLDDVWDGTVVPARAGDVPLVLVRTGEGGPEDRVCAFYDACPHERFRLSEWGEVENGVLVCGRHFWEFDAVSGRHVTRVPRPDCDLVRYETRVVQGVVEVDVASAEPGPLAAPPAGPGGAAP